MSLALHAARLDRFTVVQAERNKDSRLFVLNQSNPKGNVNVTIAASHGEKHTIQIPITYLPVDLSNQMEKESILRNPHFRRLCSNGMLVIVNPDQAEEFLKRPDVEREYRRVYGDNATIVQPATVNVQVNNNPTALEQLTVEDRALEAGISPFIVNMIARIDTGENVADLMAELDARMTELRIEELRFLADNTAEAKIKEWAEEAIGLLTT